MADTATIIVICADDFALAPGVSRGILELLQAGRISATSCMSVSPLWPEHSSWLDGVRERTDIGLHLTLTALAPLGAMPHTAPDGRLPAFGVLARNALSGRLDLEECRAELGRQLDAFETHFHRPPDFLDGHHHVHQLPGLRDVVIDIHRRRLAGSGAYLRTCWDRPGAVLRRGVRRRRALAIGFPGLALRRRAMAAGIPVNDGFSGVYDHSANAPYGALFRRFISHAGKRHLVMCHPGHPDEELARLDSLTDQREREFQFLMGADFEPAMESAGTKCGRFRAAE